MNKRNCFLIICLFIGLQTTKGQSHVNEKKFRIVGYYSLKKAMMDSIIDVPFEKLTHINLYFLNPDTSGNFNEDFSALSPFLREAHRHHVKVLPSIAGGGRHDYYHDLLKNENRGKLISRLLKIVTHYGFDGIDVDLEGSDIDENYEKFAIELAEVFHKHSKLVTAAIAVFYKDVLSDEALQQYDFVNVMSYDHTGPWRPEKPGPHSTYEQAEEDLNYFLDDRKIPKEKINLGVPFYGYGFGPSLNSKATSMNYGEIISAYPEAKDQDSLDLPGGATLYFNGSETIRRKTALAKNKASGIMIWQLSGDAKDKESLLNVINKELKSIEE
ncbi:glycosyl hydrolase family 18 protein [soil metagenome]